MMRKAIFALALAVFTVQTVGWVECCCILICKHRNDPCKDECKEQPQAAAHDCCEKPAPKTPAHQHDKRCSHVEPSNEVVSQSSEIQAAPPAIVVDLPLLEIFASEVPGTELPLQDTRGSPPLLHLLYGALLI